MSRPIVTLPVSTKVRDFDGAVLLALKFVRGGFRVALGRSDQIIEQVRAIAPAVWVEDSATLYPGKKERLEALRAAGAKVIVLESEGGIYPDELTYARVFSPQLVPLVDRVLSWGSVQRGALVRHHAFPEASVVPTGPTTFDLLHSRYRDYYAERRRELQARYGAFVMVNTNLVYANAFDSKLFEVDVADTLVAGDVCRYRAHEQRLMDALCAAIEQLHDRCPGLSIVVRPHPGERFQTYRERFASRPRIHIEHHGSVRGWLSACRAMVHHNCTTGIEARLMGVPAFAYCPLTLDMYDIQAINELCIPVTDPESLCEAVVRCLDAGPPPEYALNAAQWSVLNRYFGPLDGCAADRIVAATAELQPAACIRPAGLPGVGLRGRAKQVLNAVSPTLAEVVSAALHSGDPSIPYTRQKCAALTADEVRRAAAALRRLDPELPEVRVRRVPQARYTFWVEPVLG